MGKVLQFLKLQSHDRQLLVYTFVLLSFVRLGLQLLRYARLQTILNKLNHPDPKTPPTASILTLLWAVNAASAVMPGGVKCLARALTMDVLMRRYGYCPDLRIGFIKAPEGHPQFHAWLEYQGQVIIGHLPNLVDFQTLLSSTNSPQVQ